MSDQDPAGCICKDHKPTAAGRPLLFLPLLLLMFASVVLLMVITDLPFGVQLGSLIPYTCMAVLGTFSAQHGAQPFFFKCAIVQSTLKRLALRHVVFLIAVVLSETIAFQLTRYMPPSWLIERGKDGSPFTIGLFILCFCLAFVEIWTNRSIIERAHREKHVLL